MYVCNSISSEQSSLIHRRPDWVASKFVTAACRISPLFRKLIFDRTWCELCTGHSGSMPWHTFVIESGHVSHTPRGRSNVESSWPLHGSIDPENPHTKEHTHTHHWCCVCIHIYILYKNWMYIEMKIVVPTVLIISRGRVTPFLHWDVRKAFEFVQTQKNYLNFE